MLLATGMLLLHKEVGTGEEEKAQSHLHSPVGRGRGYGACCLSARPLCIPLCLPRPVRKGSVLLCVLLGAAPSLRCFCGDY